MTLQVIRKDGKVKGFALMFGEGRIIAAGVEDRELWRICDFCGVDEALVFCRTHSRYICGRCLAQLPSIHTGCMFISMAVARDLVQHAQKWAEVRE